MQIQKKQKGAHLLSQGYGFAEFRTPELAARALKRMAGSLLDSHALEVSYCILFFVYCILCCAVLCLLYCAVLVLCCVV